MNKLGALGEQKDHLREASNPFGEVARNLDFTPSTIYYPCSGIDLQPQAGFPKGNFIYADQRATDIQDLRRSGKKAVQVDVMTYVPDGAPVDVVVLMNPNVDPASFSHLVRVGGVILCNNHNSTADSMSSNTLFQCVGLVRTSDTEPNKWTSIGLEKLWKRTETDDELRTAGHYEYFREVVESEGEDIDDVVASYKKIYSRLQTGNVAFYPQGHPNEGQLLLKLPRLKSLGVDDICVFQKLPTAITEEPEAQAILVDKIKKIYDVASSLDQSCYDMMISSLFPETVAASIARLQSPLITLTTLTVSPSKLQELLQYIQTRPQLIATTTMRGTNDGSLSYDPVLLQTDPLLSHDPKVIDYFGLAAASSTIRDNTELVLKRIKIEPSDIQFASERLRNNKVVVAEAISVRGWQVLSAMGDLLKTDDNLFLLALKVAKDIKVFEGQDPPTQFWCKRENVLEAVSYDGMALAKAPLFQDDEEVAWIAVNEDREAYSHISDRLKSLQRFSDFNQKPPQSPELNKENSWERVGAIFTRGTPVEIDENGRVYSVNHNTGEKQYL
ncbi:DUF4116 domain-containing protein [Candidatus Gracilibacteria bacterium]|nr:DUF4116 domain-containing protein [Candidatus Gracilibacteria bacterium]